MTRSTGIRKAASSTAPKTDCYLPLYIFCSRHLLATKLCRANIDASAGAVEEVQHIVLHIRARWPRVRIVLRADSGFAREPLMLWCEQNRVDFVIGVARNTRLETRVTVALQKAQTRAEATGQPARVYDGACLYLRAARLRNRALGPSSSSIRRS